MLVDSHCHIHEPDYPIDAEEVIKRAHENDVQKIICIGTSVDGSRQAIEFASKHDNIFATIGIHPHYAKDGIGELETLFDVNNKKIVAVGEIGLDYHYNFSPKVDQINLLKTQIDLALKHNLPIIFHVREAFDDFWPIFDSYISSGSEITGVLHGFSDMPENVQKALDRGLYIGVTGISTFTKDEIQKKMFATIPLDRILLETDAPYLTPVPFRGKINEPAFVRCIADYSGIIRQISFDEVANTTTASANALFRL